MQRVRWKACPVEACVTPWQVGWVPPLLNCETPGSVRSLQVLEPVDRYPRRSSDKLKETRLALGGPTTDALPEPLNNFIRLVISSVIRELVQIITDKTYGQRS
jgi:hypothetical protein